MHNDQARVAMQLHGMRRASLCSLAFSASQHRPLSTAKGERSRPQNEGHGSFILHETSFDALVVILSRLRVDGKQRADGAWVACFNFPSFKARIAIRRTCAGVIILP